MIDDLRPQIVREAKHRLDDQRKRAKAFLSYGSKPFAMNTFIEGGCFAMELFRPILETARQESKEEIKNLRHEIKLLKDRLFRIQRNKPKLTYRRSPEPDVLDINSNQKIHFAPDEEHDKICNTKAGFYLTFQITKDPSKVTCGHCLSLIRSTK